MKEDDFLGWKRHSREKAIGCGAFDSRGRGLRPFRRNSRQATGASGY